MNWNKTDLHAIAKSLNYRDWDEIRQAVTDQLNLPKPTPKELVCLAGYVSKPKVSFQLLEHAIKLEHKINHNELPLPKQVDFCQSIGKKKGFLLLLNGNAHSPSSLIATFNCVDCGSEFTVDLNPARGFGEFDIPACKPCKKSIVHKCSTYRDKYEKTMVDKYGAKRPLQTTTIHNKFVATMQERYGVNYSAESPVLYAKAMASRHSLWATSQLEHAVATAVTNLFKDKVVSSCLGSERPKVFVSKSGKYLYPDIVVDNQLAIEVFGDYWHGNPNIYTPEAIVAHDMFAMKQWEEDAIRLNLLRSQGLQVLVIWEQDWHKNSNSILEKVKSCLK